MEKFITTIKKTLVSLYLLVFCLFYSFPVLLASAEETETTMGPTEPIGLQSETGRIESDRGPVGLVEPTGPQDTGDSGLTNSITGSKSENVNSIENSDDVLVETNNSERTDNNVDLDLNSGKNTVQSNTGVDSLSTGNIEGSVNLINLANSELAPGSSVGAETIDGSNIGDFQVTENNIPTRVLFPNSIIGGLGNNLTGNRSLNTNNFDNNNIVSFILDNDILRNNLIDINANTGENLIDSNTSIGEINTGDIDLGVNIINLSNIINENLLAELNIWSIMNGLDGDIILPSNTATGPGSENLNLIDQSTRIDTEVNTSTENNNDFDILTNTGENLLKNNSSLGDISTGDMEVEGSITNITDGPVFYVINVFGKFLGNILTNSKNFIINEINPDNQLTGPNSLNENEINTNTEADTDINSIVTNNNHVNINANTGRNNVTNNTSVESVKTGSINIISNVINAAGFLGKKLKLGVINIFGNFEGNIVGEEQELGAAIGEAQEENLPAQAEISPEEMELPGEQPMIEFPMPRVLGQVEELPISGIWSNQPDNITNPSDENDEKQKKLMTMVVLPASLLLALSLCGELYLRKRSKISTK